MIEEARDKKESTHRSLTCKQRLFQRAKKKHQVKMYIYVYELHHTNIVSIQIINTISINFCLSEEPDGLWINNI